MAQKNLRPKNLLDSLSPSDLEKINSYKAGKNSFPVDEEWMILAEWLRIAGYQAYLDAKNDTRDNNGNLIITMPEILTLIEANRKLESLDHYKNAHAAFIGAVSAQAKKPSRVFRSLVKDIIKNFKVEE